MLGRGCGRFLGDRTEGFGRVQSRGTQAGSGTLSHDINDDRRSGRTSRLSDQAVPGTLAGEGFPLCWAYEEPHHPPGNRAEGGLNRYWAACGRGKPPGNPAWAWAPWPIGSRRIAGAAWPRCRPGTGMPRAGRRGAVGATAWRLPRR